MWIIDYANCRILLYFKYIYILIKRMNSPARCHRRIWKYYFAHCSANTLRLSDWVLPFLPSVCRWLIHYRRSAFWILLFRPALVELEALHWRFRTDWTRLKCVSSLRATITSHHLELKSGFLFFYRCLLFYLWPSKARILNVSEGPIWIWPIRILNTKWNNPKLDWRPIRINPIQNLEQLI